VPDPYRWLEDADSAETQRWITAQNQLTRGFLDQLPVRAKIRTRPTRAVGFRALRAAVRARRALLLLLQLRPTESAGALLVALAGRTATLLLDPNLLSSDGTVALSHVEPTEDGKLIAYGLFACRLGLDRVARTPRR